MATFTGDFDAGRASFASEEFTQSELITGNTPMFVSAGPEIVPENTDWDNFVVVGRNAAGRLTKATYLGSVAGQGSDVASGLFTFTTPPDAADTFTVGDVTYTWIATVAAVDQVLLGATAAEAAANAAAAINADAAAVTALVIHEDQVEHPTVHAEVSGTVVTLYAKTPGAAGNAIATTQVGDEAAFGAATLTGGEGAGVRAIGVTTSPVLTGAGVETTMDIIRQGCLNPDKLVWDASFDTDAKKKTAFEGAPTPTNIVIQKIKYGAVFPS